MHNAAILIDIAAAAWVFYLGASIGSFANVVAWRMPRGVPFAASTSKCPTCGRGIRFTDNIPVLGWLLLRGRCRYCQSPISVRYLLVELAYGSGFLLLYFLELRLGGVNIPGFAPNPGAAALDWPWIAQPRLLGIYAYHATLFSILGIIWLIQFQGDRVPWRLWWFGVIVGIGCGSVWPWLRGDHFDLQSNDTLVRAMGAGVASVLFGLLIDFVTGWILPNQARSDLLRATPTFALLGAFVVQEMLIPAPAVLAGMLIFRFLSPKRFVTELVWTSWTLAYFAVLLVMAWRSAQDTRMSPKVPPPSWIWLFLGWVVVLVGVAAGAFLYGRASSHSNAGKSSDST